MSPVIKQPGQEFFGVPVGTVSQPAGIRPQKIRLILIDQFIQLRRRFVLQHTVQSQFFFI
jgi:hypothetical protein